MARKKREKEKVTDPFERARLKKLRSAERREARKRRKLEAGDDDRSSRRETKPDYAEPMVKDDYLWIRRGLAKNYAMRIINDHKERPYWLSIPHERGVGPVTNFFPCTTFRARGRMFYGFLFREHRDLFFDSLEDARKELTDTIRSLNPNLFI